MIDSNLSSIDLEMLYRLSMLEVAQVLCQLDNSITLDKETLQVAIVQSKDCITIDTKFVKIVSNKHILATILQIAHKSVKNLLKSSINISTIVDILKEKHGYLQMKSFIMLDELSSTKYTYKDKKLIKEEDNAR